MIRFAHPEFLWLLALLPLLALWRGRKGRVAGCAFLATAALFAGYVFVRRQHHLARDPSRVRTVHARREVQTQLTIMESAVVRGAAADFFAAAHGAFQTLLSLRWRLPPQAISLADVNARMNGEAEGFRFIFELADEVAYTGRTFAPAELQNWLTTVQIELKRLEAAARITNL